jgi:hypothetical protein
MNRPTDSQECVNEWCGHSFAKHYTTYDGKKHGCSNYVDEQRDGGPCFCQGFAIVQAWKPEIPSSSPTGDYWTDR